MVDTQIIFKDGDRGMRGIMNVKHTDMMSALELPPSATTYPVELPEVIAPASQRF